MLCSKAPPSQQQVHSSAVKHALVCPGHLLHAVPKCPPLQVWPWLQCFTRWLLTANRGILLQSLLKHSLLQAKRVAQQPPPCHVLAQHGSGPDLTEPECLEGPALLAVHPDKGSTCDGSSFGFSASAGNNTQSQPPQAYGQYSSGTGKDAGCASSECVICWEAAPDVLLQPCGHICICSGCAAFLESDCPMCRCTVKCSIVLQL